MSLTIHSGAFRSNGGIPRHYSRDGANVSPPVEWHDAPAGTESFVLVVEDPDAPKGTFRHWAAYDIPATSTSLREGVGSHPQGGLLMGRNDFGNDRYDGPQPPPGHGVHHYHFRLLALGVAKLGLPAHSSGKDILAAARANCLEEAEVVGTFETPGGIAKSPGDTPNERSQTTRGEQPDSQVRHHVADSDKLVRTGSASETVRDTPPAGKWNDVAKNE